MRDRQDGWGPHLCPDIVLRLLGDLRCGLGGLLRTLRLYPRQLRQQLCLVILQRPKDCVTASGCQHTGESGRHRCASTGAGLCSITAASLMRYEKGGDVQQSIALAVGASLTDSSSSSESSSEPLSASSASIAFGTSILAGLPSSMLAVDSSNFRSSCRSSAMRTVWPQTTGYCQTGAVLMLRC